jgi:hypothetical protein
LSNGRKGKLVHPLCGIELNKPRLEEYFQRLKNFHQKRDSVQALLCGAEKDRTAEETNPTDVITWANNIIDAALQSVADACRDDGPALVDLARIRGERYLFQR